MCVRERERGKYVCVRETKRVGERKSRREGGREREIEICLMTEANQDEQ